MYLRKIAAIGDKRGQAKEIASRVINKANKEGRKFGDVLEEELKKECSSSSFDDNWTGADKDV